MSADLNFDRAVEITLDFEGEWSNDSFDPGGLTRWGIAQRWHPGIDVANLTRAGAIEILRAEYWQPIQGPRLPWPLAAATFDHAVHSGAPHAIQALQRGLGVAADGIMGRKTLAALASRGPARTSLRAQYLTLVGQQRRRIAELLAEPHAPLFQLGWMCRVAELGMLCGVELGRTPWDPWEEDSAGR